MSSKIKNAKPKPYMVFIEDSDNKEIKFYLPLLAPGTKTRTKEIYNNKSIPIKLKEKAINKNTYIEHQIEYYKKEFDELTTIDYKLGGFGKKAFYPSELSTIFYKFIEWKIINCDEIEKLKELIKNNISKNNFLDVNPELSITDKIDINMDVGKKIKDNFINISNDNINYRVEQIVSNHLFFYVNNNPQLQYEIEFKQKQKVSGNMGMVYVLIYFDKLFKKQKDDKVRSPYSTEFNVPTVEPKEMAYWIIDKKDKDFILLGFTLFSYLSKKHAEDIFIILDNFSKHFCKALENKKTSLNNK